MAQKKSGQIPCLLRFSCTWRLLSMMWRNAEASSMIPGAVVALELLMKFLSDFCEVGAY